MNISILLPTLRKNAEGWTITGEREEITLGMSQVQSLTLYSDKFCDIITMTTHQEQQISLTYPREKGAAWAYCGYAFPVKELYSKMRRDWLQDMRSDEET
ncbi:MAG: hypothetical protein JW764_01665 [Chlorobiaceae bacterium]|nr:hypothetical protein [Chlorobiaceae bacterium]